MEIVAFYAQTVSIFLEIASFVHRSKDPSNLSEICPCIFYSTRIKHVYCLMFPRTKGFGIMF